MTIAELKALIDANYPNNILGLITPAKEREVLKAIVDALGTGGVLSTAIINALNAAAAPDSSNPFATIADIPGGLTGNRIVDPGELVINSPTSATLTGLEWIWEGVSKTYTGDLTLTTSPTDPDNRFDIITLSEADIPAVQTGTADPEPAVPNPTTAGHLLAHTIYRPFTGEDAVQPTPPATVFSTQSVSGQYENYAKIWEQTVNANTYYDFKIGYVAWSSNYDSDRQRPMNGFLSVNFVTKGAATEVDPNRVNVQTMDISPRSGDFVLVQTDTNKAALFVKKTGFFQTLVFEYTGGKTPTVKDNSLVNQGAYATLPTGANWPSWNGRSFITSTGTTIQFDRPRSYGVGTPLTGNITIATAYADDSVMVKVIHNDITEPTITVPVGVTKKMLSGAYAADTDNLFLFIIDKDSSGDVVAVNYTISQNTL